MLGILKFLCGPQVKDDEDRIKQIYEYKFLNWDYEDRTHHSSQTLSVIGFSMIFIAFWGFVLGAAIKLFINCFSPDIQTIAFFLLSLVALSGISMIVKFLYNRMMSVLFTNIMIEATREAYKRDLVGKKAKQFVNDYVDKNWRVES